MPGWMDIADKAEEAIKSYWEQRNKKMLALRQDIEKYWKVDKDSVLAKQIAWFLTEK